MLWSRHFEEFSLKMRYMLGVECKAHTDRNHMEFYIWLKFLSVYIQCIVLHRVPQIAILRYAVNIDKFSMDMYFDEVYGFIFALVLEVKNRTGCEVQCNKCQFLGSWTLTSINFSRGLRKHREEKHRIWECLCCGASFPNKVDFKNHIERRNCVLHKFGMPYLECGSDDPIP